MYVFVSSNRFRSRFTVAIFSTKIELAHLVDVDDDVDVEVDGDVEVLDLE